MSAELLLSFCNFSVLPRWALLVFAPKWKWSARLICPVVLPSLLAVLYVVLLVSQWSQLEGGFGSLPEVAKLFENPYALLAGWIHYLAFDLFIGSWEVRDAQQLGIRHWLVVPCLAFTLLFGPLGLLLYFVVRSSVKQRVVVETA